MTTKQTGRPPSYSDQDHRSAIETIETIGEQVTAEAVTKFFKEELGLKSKPRREPLHAKIEDFLAHREDATTDRNIRALPKEFRGSISVLTANLEKEWLALGANSYAELKCSAQAIVVEKEAECLEKSARIRELERCLKNKDAMLDEAREETKSLERAVHRETERADFAEREIGALMTKLEAQMSMFELFVKPAHVDTPKNDAA